MFWFIKKIFWKENIVLPQRSLDDIKRICKITFVDDKKFPIIDILKIEWWRNITKINDVKALDQNEIRDSHIIMMDIQWVWKKLQINSWGLWLIKAIKMQYPSKIVIAYSWQENWIVSAFSEIELADDRIDKNSDSYLFTFKIQKWAKTLFSLEECLARISLEIKKELWTTPKSNELLKNLKDIYEWENYSEERIKEVFS